MKMKVKEDYIGIFRNGDKWGAKISHNRAARIIGDEFPTAKEAAIAYDAAALNHRTSGAKGRPLTLNFPRRETPAIAANNEKSIHRLNNGEPEKRVNKPKKNKTIKARFI